MANQEHYKVLCQGKKLWNEWRQGNPGVEVDLSGVDLRRYELRAIDLRGADLSESKLNGAGLEQAMLDGARLIGAILDSANLRGADLGSATLVQATLNKADLSGANLRGADLQYAKMAKAVLVEADLEFANLNEADLREADFTSAHLSGANVSEANLSRANLYRANLRSTDMSNSDLGGANFRSANLHYAVLDGANATNIKLWETLRAGWSIKNIICERAYWDEEATEPTEYEPREFERIYSDQTCIELYYKGGVSTFELSTLPALLHYLASLHPDSSIRLKSIEETGGGARISISVGDSDPETTEKIKADAMQIYHAQLALRDKETERLQIERDYIERLFLGKLIPAMLTAGAPQNVFNAPVTGVVIATGESKVDFHQTLNDNSAILALLEKLMGRYTELGLSGTDAAKFQSELQSATTELEKKAPDKSILSKSVGLLQKLANEAITKAAGKLGESAVADWQTWLHQLTHFISHLN